MVRDGTWGYAVDDGSGLHFVGTRLREVVSSRPAARAYRLTVKQGRTHAGAGAADFVRDLLQGVPSAIPGSQSSHRALAVRPASATRSGLVLCHYVVDIGRESDGPGNCMIRENFAEKFGESFLVQSENEEQLSFGRVFENYLPISSVE